MRGFHKASRLEGAMSDELPVGGLRITPRENEILRLIACDQSDKEIARALRISQHTLRTHLSRLFRRHGLHSRAAAVAAWLGYVEAAGVAVGQR